MDKFKEFQGKDLDEAIQKACDFFDCVREKMEIEILQDAKSGIFGIVGARKAKIRARRAHLRDAVEKVLGKTPEDEKVSHDRGNREDNPIPVQVHPKNEAAPGTPHQKKDGQIEQPRQKKTDGRQDAEGDGKNQRPKSRRRENSSPSHEGKKGTKPESGVQQHQRGRHVQEKRTAHAAAPAREMAAESLDNSGDYLDDMEDGLPIRPLEELDTARVGDVVTEVVTRLIAPIAGKVVPVQVEVGQNRIRAKVDWQGDAGLLIGREGLTLVALQYLASRMVSRAMNMALRVQLDIGDYHKRQEDKLRETARILAEKARRSGKSWSTRPLSSYHRRIIHLALQDEQDVQTRSSGDGPLKRVIISPAKAQAGEE